MKSYTGKYEIVLKVVNSIYGVFLGHFLALMFIFYFMAGFVCAFGGTACIEYMERKPNSFISYVLNGDLLFKSMPILITLTVIILILNVWLVITMRKINRENKSDVGFVVNKITYIVMAFLFGGWGLHKFVAKDNRRGLIHIVLFFLLPIALEILSHINANLLLFTLVGPLLSISLAWSDIWIGISKVSDHNKNILV